MCKEGINMSLILKKEIDISEVKRYLRVKTPQLDPLTESQITTCIEELLEDIEPRYIYKEFNLKLHPDGYLLENTNLVLAGNSITKHLRYSHTCVLMATTLGILMDKKLLKYNKIDLSKALICDACATTLIEEICDQVERHIWVNHPDMIFTRRFSPGYGDLGLNFQPKILSVLEATKKIGLTATQGNILLPSKSVTAIIGISAKDGLGKDKQVGGNQKVYTAETTTACNSCRHVNYCYYLIEGRVCEFQRKIS